MAAAGIGEASAILTVAQLGISLSKSLLTYIEEVKGAPLHIQRIGNEILTTSERLKDIGELVDQNLHTKVFSEEGINSAVRCSAECQQIIQDVRIVLYKGGWQNNSKDADQGAVDTSLFSTLRWPFVKIKLEVPRAELHRIKIDLSLLFSAAMVLGASTTVERQRLAQDIPGLHKARAWAAERAEQVKEFAQNRPRRSRAHDDDEPEMLEEFVTFKERLFREEEEQRIRDRAKIIQAEDDARKRQEEDAQREIERKAIEEYKKQEQEQETRSAEKRNNFRNELERLGLESAQIQVVMESTNLDFQAVSGTAFVPEVRPSFAPGELSHELETTPSATSGRSRISLPWWRSKRSTRESSPEPSLNIVLPESSTGPSTKLEIETWLIDVYSDRSTKFIPSADWLIAKLKTIKKDQDVWNRFANLRPHWRNAILDFLKFVKNSEWILYHLDVPQRWSRTRLFGQRRDEQLVQLVLCRRRINDEDGDMRKSRPKTEGRGDSLPKRVSFATKFEEDSGAESDVNAASDHILPRYISDLKERITILEEKRNRLGVDDQERVGDLNDMIAYLRDQLSDATHTGALNTIAFQDERQPKPRRSESIRAPTIIHEEYIPHQSRRDDIIVSNENSDRVFSPPSRRPSNADNTTVASYYPHFTHDDLEIRETESSPGKTDYEDRHGVSDDIYYEPRERRRSHREVEDIIVEEDVDTTYHGNDRSSQKGWRERSRYRLPPSRQYSTSTRGGPLVTGIRERSWERSNSRPSRASRQPYREIDYDDYFERQMVGNDHMRSRNRTRERKEAWSPKRREIVIRAPEPEFEEKESFAVEEEEPFPRKGKTTMPGKLVNKRAIIELGYPFEEEGEMVIILKVLDKDQIDEVINVSEEMNRGASKSRRNERSKPRPRERQNLSSSESEYPYNGSRGRRGQPIVGESAQSQALVLRAGASSLPHEYIRERVLNGGIRVRGDDDIGSPRPEYVTLQHVRRPRPPTSRMGSYRDRSRAPSLRRRLSETWQQFEPSEDDEYRYPSMKRVDSERKGSEAELSDAEVIAQTLKKFTTIQDSDMPRTNIAAPSIQKKRGSETEVGPSALKNMLHPLPGLERKNSLPVPGGRKAHFEQENEDPQPGEERQSRATNEGSKSVDERTFLDKISEEPDVIIESDDVPHHQRFVYFPERPVLPRPQQAPSFPFPTDLDHHSREASPRPQSRNPNLDSPRSRPGNGPSITEHGGHFLASQGEIPDHAAQEERYDEVENT